MKNIIIFGSPGAGKGTLIDLLTEKGVPFSLINPGQMLRDITKEDSEFSRKIQKTMIEGGLVDDFVVNELVKKKIRELDKTKPVIFDSYPRNLGQLEIADEMFKEAGLDLPVLVYVKITKEEAIKRLSECRVCSVCKENFQLFELSDPEKCEKCGGKIIQREDDKPAIIESRFETFDLQFELIQHYFKVRDRYFEIDSTKPKPERLEDLIKIIQG